MIVTKKLTRSIRVAFRDVSQSAVICAITLGIIIAALIVPSEVCTSQHAEPDAVGTHGEELSRIQSSFRHTHQRFLASDSSSEPHINGR